MYKAFFKVYGDKAGWAHQILFAGELTDFKDKVNSPEETQNTNSDKKSKVKSVAKPENKKRKEAQFKKQPELD